MIILLKYLLVMRCEVDTYMYHWFVNADLSKFRKLKTGLTNHSRGLNFNFVRQCLISPRIFSKIYERIELVFSEFLIWRKILQKTSHVNKSKTWYSEAKIYTVVLLSRLQCVNTTKSICETTEVDDNKTSLTIFYLPINLYCQGEDIQNLGFDYEKQLSISDTLHAF